MEHDRTVSLFGGWVIVILNFSNIFHQNHAELVNFSQKYAEIIPRKYLFHQYKIINIWPNYSGCISLITSPIFNLKAFPESLDLKLSIGTKISMF